MGFGRRLGDIFWEEFILQVAKFWLVQLFIFSMMFESGIEQKIHFSCENVFPLTVKKAGLENCNMSQLKETAASISARKL